MFVISHLHLHEFTSPTAYTSPIDARPAVTCRNLHVYLWNLLSTSMSDPIVLIAKHEIFAISDQLGSSNAFICVSIARLYVVLSREQSPS